MFKATSERVTQDDFMLLKLLGKGAYGKVVLVKKKDTGRIYAMKVIKKELAEKKKNNGYIATERSVLSDVDHPFIINLAFAFQTERKLYFIMEYCPGGDLFSLLQRKKRLTEDETRFYIAQVCLAIDHLHSKNIIYRE